MTTHNNSLISKAQAGDIKAFHELFSEFRPQLRVYIYRLTADRNDADDLAQDAFVKAFDKISTFKKGKRVLRPGFLASRLI